MHASHVPLTHSHHHTPTLGYRAGGRQHDTCTLTLDTSHSLTLRLTKELQSWRVIRKGKGARHVHSRTLMYCALVPVRAGQPWSLEQRPSLCASVLVFFKSTPGVRGGKRLLTPGFWCHRLVSPEHTALLRRLFLSDSTVGDHYWRLRAQWDRPLCHCIGLLYQ